MIFKVEITISIDGTKETANFTCDNKSITIIFTMKSGLNKTYSDSNFYRCFARIREDNPNIQFLCKGSKLNVHPSSMSSQMSLGLKAYELTLGKTSSLNDVVYIFDYEDNNLTNDPHEQLSFYRRWIESEKI
ncbi:MULTISPECIES: hypothetical protein [Pseudomonas]|uniref:Uncharacterized protein n=1 Tax=Pseudomonas wuhanensis TaxID=2954098 RepID=A0ABY9GX22_9PSED|nr:MULTISPECIES: hypothetical protein [unclassified Pseudomonas]WLI14450.1 hypothetical protein PSH65_10130 [Pseudomonas sp. FP603]WLI20367.1 hypothetical protein PSH88_10150 [Pseudomonas sp. FP607]